MGATNRSTLERPATTLSTAPDLPPLVPDLGPAEGVQKDPYRTWRGSLPAREHRYTRNIYRWQFHPRKKRGHFVGPTKRGKGTKVMAIADASGLPVAIDIQSASPHEVKLVESTIKSRFVSKPPKRLIGDKAYDSDPLDNLLREHYGTELIAPHKANRKKPKTQDGRALRRYRRRWKVERLFSWLHNFRRLVTRWEYHADNFLGMLQLGCIVILLRYF